MTGPQRQKVRVPLDRRRTGRTDANVKDLRDAQVPRKQLDRVFDGYDQRFADQQRQMDELNRAQGSVYSLRDVILNYGEPLDRLERPLSNAGG